MMRERKRDFQVREVTLGGEVLRLSGPLWNKRHAAETEATAGDRTDLHLHFRLYQEGVGTQEALGVIARCLKRKLHTFCVAGIKDRRSISIQRVSVRGVRRSALRRAVLDPLWCQRIRFSDLEYNPHPLRLGELGGNHFDLALRGVPREFAETSAGMAVVQRAMEALQHRGFLNYFGLQRFGTQVISPHTVGAALVSGNYSRALELILGDAVVDLLAVSGSARRAAAREALRKLPSRMFVERELLRSIANDLSPETAMRRLPWLMIFRYLAAAQSIVFNRVLSQRIRRYGREPVAEDLRLSSDADGAPLAVASVGSFDFPTMDNGTDGGSLLQHVVLPLPGRAVSYPAHLVDEYSEASEEMLGLPLAAFSDCRPMALDGAYRPVVAVPKNFTWRIVSADEVGFLGNRLLQSDVDRLYAAERELPPLGDARRRRPDVSADDIAEEPESTRVPVGAVTDDTAALVLSCTLPSSAYVTMAVRELTRGGVVVRETAEHQYPTAKRQNPPRRNAASANGDA
eukprot:TRINITY_DN16235_c0_g1_i1.p1 TRINITY_DN16235_c0_g1~~TRINITY_DN16235_c0_g1_i1.p1  ORF type:complete len:605 (-),score=82.73 TRINITY_DN16235_c0_g1_i1:264-1811(-)